MQQLKDSNLAEELQRDYNFQGSISEGVDNNQNSFESLDPELNSFNRRTMTTGSSNYILNPFCKQNNQPANSGSNNGFNQPLNLNSPKPFNQPFNSNNNNGVNQPGTSNKNNEFNLIENSNNQKIINKFDDLDSLIETSLILKNIGKKLDDFEQIPN